VDAHRGELALKAPAAGGLAVRVTLPASQHPPAREPDLRRSTAHEQPAATLS
jgi:hypothetical protein